MGLWKGLQFLSWSQGRMLCLLMFSTEWPLFYWMVDVVCCHWLPERLLLDFSTRSRLPPRAPAVFILFALKWHFKKHRQVNGCEDRSKDSLLAE